THGARSARAISVGAQALQDAAARRGADLLMLTLSPRAIIVPTQRRAIQREQPPEQQPPPSRIEREMRVQRKRHRRERECGRERAFACGYVRATPRADR